MVFPGRERQQAEWRWHIWLGGPGEMEVMEGHSMWNMKWEWQPWVTQWVESAFLNTVTAVSSCISLHLLAIFAFLCVCHLFRPVHMDLPHSFSLLGYLVYSWVISIGKTFRLTWWAQLKNPPAMWESQFNFLLEDPSEGKATTLSILAWRMLWTVESMGSQRAWHDWVTFTTRLTYIWLDYFLKANW